MNPDFKCDCTHCGEPISFPADSAGQTAECPHCLHPTILKVQSTPDGPPIIQQNILEPIEPEKKEPIEATLDDIGQIFFVIGLVGAGIAGVMIFFYMASSTGGLDSEEKYLVGLAIAGAVIMVGQGIIIKTLFRAAGECIRLLRKISNNKTT